MKERSLTVIIPAFNEEVQLRKTYETIRESLDGLFSETRIIIVDDGSGDGTPEIADTIAADDAGVTVVHNESPRCLGGVYKQALGMVTTDHVVLVNAKNVPPADSLAEIWRACDTADMIVPYPLNSNERPWIRRVVSRTYTTLISLLFRLRLQYYNHYVVHRTKLARAVDVSTDSYAFQAEMLIKLIHLGYSYREVGIVDNFKDESKSRAFRRNNVIGVARFIWTMFWDITVRRRYRPACGITPGESRI